MLLPLDDLNEMRQLPISLVIIAIIINGIYNHWVYKSIVTFLFEKGLTNRQKREWRKEKYFKRKSTGELTEYSSAPKKNHALHKSGDKEPSGAEF